MTMRLTLVLLLSVVCVNSPLAARVWVQVAGGDPDLVAYWPFDDDAADATGNGYDGDIVGATPAPGQIGGALAFDGVDDHVSIAGTTGLHTVTAGPHSMVAWVYLNAPIHPDYMKFVVDAHEPTAIGNEGDQRGLRFWNGVPVFKWVTTNASNHAFGFAPLAANRWYLLVGTFDGSVGRLYVNGVLNGVSPSTGPATVASRWSIGDISGGGTGTGQFPGRIDDVRIYRRALTQEEVAHMYPTDTSSDLVAHWTFDEDAVDVTGNGHDGDIRGAVAASGRLDGALAFDGVDDYVAIPNSAGGLNTVTAAPHSITSWVYIDPSAPSNLNKFIIDALEPTAPGDQGDQRGLRLENGRPVFKWVTTSASYRATALPLSYGEWHLVVGTFDGAQGAVYVDGALVATGSSIGIPTAASRWKIGDISGGGTGAGFFPGVIDDVRVYRRALALDEVVALFAPDTVPPVIICEPAGTAWQGINVVINCTASDQGSGLADPVDAAFTLTSSVPTGVETADAGTDARTVCDKLGNCAVAGPISGLRVDRRPPTIAVTAPSAGSYALGQTIEVAYRCEDGGSGVATCQGTASDGAPLRLDSVGSHVFEVTAVDHVGNQGSSSVPYSVSFAVCPRFNQGHVHPGRAVPVRFSLCTANGENVSSASHSVHATRLIQGGIEVPFGDVGRSNPGGAYRFDDGQYIFNLGTSGLTGTYEFFFAVSGDPQEHSVIVRVR